MAEYRALYRKWRPPDFDDVRGQNGITDILKYEVANNKLSHAYLFCGSRGTGKTSCAKILAKAVNCENPINGNPCNKCEACRSIDAGIATDVIEMDAASNNGIGDVRDMQDEIAFTPAILKYRVYIIDEVHMMSTQAFNALLKTLEEPPSYVIFILATTEYNKLPTTIISRCQRFDFKRISNEVITERLLELSSSEGIEITADAARVIARVSRGGMRDAMSLLELCAGAHKPIDEELVFETVGGGNKENAYKLVEAICAADYSTVYSIVDDVVMISGDISVFWQEIIDSYRDIMVVKNSPKAKEYLDLTETEYKKLLDISQKLTMSRLSYHVSLLEGAMADMQRAFNSKRSIAEIALTRMCDARSSATAEALAERVEELERELKMIKLGVVTPSVSDIQPEPKFEVTAPKASPAQNFDEEKASAQASDAGIVKAEQVSSQASPAPILYAKWPSAIKRIGEVRVSLSACMAGASAYINPDGSFSLKVKEFFAKKIAESDTDMAIIRGVIGELEGKRAQEIKVSVNGIVNISDSAIAEIEAILNNK